MCMKEVSTIHHCIRFSVFVDRVYESSQLAIVAPVEIQNKPLESCYIYFITLLPLKRSPSV
jgi:hypothetical protein